jgi:hypothetical protein
MTALKGLLDSLFNLLNQPTFDLIALICLSSTVLIILHVVRASKLAKIKKRLSEAQNRQNVLF